MRCRMLSLLLVGLLAFSLTACGASQTGLSAQELEGNIGQEGQPNAQLTGTPLTNIPSTPASTPGQDQEGALGTLSPLQGEPPDALPLDQLNTPSQLQSYRKQSIVRYAPQGQPERALQVITEAANQANPLDLDVDTLEHTTIAFFEGGQRTERTQFVWIGEGRYWADVDGTWQQVDFGPAEYVEQFAFGEQGGAELAPAFLFADNMWPFSGQAEFAGVGQVDGTVLWRYVADVTQFGGGTQGLEGFTEGEVTAWVNPELAVITRVEGNLTNSEADSGPMTLFFVMDLTQVHQAPDMVPDVLFAPEQRLQFQVDPAGAITVSEVGTVSAAGADVPTSLDKDIRPLTVLRTYQRYTVVTLAPQGADGPVRRVEILAASAADGGAGTASPTDETEGDQTQEDQPVAPDGDTLRAVDIYFVEDNQVVGLAQFLGINEDYWVKDANGWTNAGRTPAEYISEVGFFSGWDGLLDANWLFDERVWFFGDMGGEEGLIGVETIDGQEYWRYEYGDDQTLADLGGLDQFEDGRVVAWVHPTHHVVTRLFVVAIDENPATTDFEQVDALDGAEGEQNTDAPRPGQEGLEEIQGVLDQDNIPAGVPAGAAVLTIETNIIRINEPVTITAPDELADISAGQMEAPQGTSEPGPTR